MRNVTVLMSNRCNMRCMHCMSNSGKASPSEPVFRERARLLANLRELGTERVVLSGGEPLLRREEAYAFLGDAHDIGMVTGLLTNGLLLDEQVVEELHARHIGRVALSIYSQDITGYTAGRQRVYRNRIHRALRALEARGISYAISIPTHASNIAETLHSIAVVARLKLAPQRIRILYVSPSGRGGTLPTIATPSTWFLLVKRCQDLKDRLGISIELAASSFGVLSDAYKAGCPIRHINPDRPEHLADPHVSEAGDLVLCGLLIRDSAHQVANVITDTVEHVRHKIRTAATAMMRSVGANHCPISSESNPAPCVLHEVVM